MTKPFLWFFTEMHADAVARGYPLDFNVHKEPAARILFNHGGENVTIRPMHDSPVDGFSISADMPKGADMAAICKAFTLTFGPNGEGTLT